MRHTNAFLSLTDALGPGDSQVIALRLDAAPGDAAAGGTLRLDLFQAGVGRFTGTGRANSITLPCSEEAFVRLVRHLAPVPMPDHRPRIHWVSPLPPAQTDIAHYTRRFLPELAARAEVTLWTDAATHDDELARFCRVGHMDPAGVLPRHMRPRGDPDDRPGTVFVNIGNSWVFHAGLLRLARRMPSVVVLHDLAIQEMCLDAVRNSLMSRQDYLAAMHRWYGAAGHAAARDALAGHLPATDLGRMYPGFEIAIDKAVAVVTHTPAATDAVAARGHVPVYQLNLPFRATGPGVAARAPDGPLRLVQFGHVGPNRRLEQVLEVLAGMGPGFDFVFDIAGKLWNPEHVKARCRDLGLSGKVHLHGYVPEPELDALIARAHLVFNLRHPTMGEASGSQLRIWNAAAASVVTDQGWYGTLPDDTVFRIPLEDETAALRQLLARLAEDRDAGQALGLAGHRRLVAHHDPACYADGIVAVAGAYENDARDALVAEAARRVLARGPERPARRGAAGIEHARLARLFQD